MPNDFPSNRNLLPTLEGELKTQNFPGSNMLFLEKAHNIFADASFSSDEHSLNLTIK
jgi:hypothetical protein